MNLNQQHIRSLIAPHYTKACLEIDHSMIKFAKLMEDLEEKFLNENPYDVWERLTLDQQAYDTPFYLETLVSLEKDYHEKLFEVSIKEIHEAYSESATSGFDLWEKTYLQALEHWNGVVFMSLCEHPFPFSEKQKEILKNYQELNKFIINSHWLSVRPHFLNIAKKEDLSKESKSNFLIYAGQIELYHILPDAEQAKIYFDEAHETFQNDNTFRALGEYYLKKQEFELAKTHFLKAIEMDPCDIENCLYLGDSYREDKNETAAKQWYNDAIQMNFLQTLPYRRKLLLSGMNKSIDKKQAQTQEILNRIDVLSFEHPYNTNKYEFLRDAGHSFTYAQNFEDALVYYTKAKTLFPDNSGAYIDLGYIYAQIKEFDKAEEAFLKANSLIPNHFDVFWGLAYLYEQMEDWAKVITNYQKCIPLRPTQKDAILFNLAFCFEKIQDIPKAISHYQEAYALNDSYYRSDDILTTLLESHGTEEELLAHLDKRASVNFDDPLLINDVGVFHSTRKNHEMAIPYFEKSIALDPHEPVYFENLGLSFEALGQYDKARECYQNAANIEQVSGQFHNRLGYFYCLRSQYEEAIPLFQVAVERNPDVITYVNNLGTAYNRTQRHADAISILKKAIGIDPENLATNNEIGVAYLEEERYEEALPHLEKAAALEPSSWLHQENLGVWNQRQGLYEEAILCFAKGIEVDPKAHSIFNRVGQVYYESHQYDESIKYYQKALTLDPENEIYKANLELAITENGGNDKELRI